MEEFSEGLEGGAGSFQSSLDRRIACLDSSICNFADTPSAAPRKRKNLWKVSQHAPSLTHITNHYAPVNHHAQFQDLYRVLRAALVDRTNASAFLQGTRGTGKMVLLNSVVAAVADELVAENRSLFRVVHVNGITVPGYSVQTVVREIVQQLSEQAFQETAAAPANKKANDNDSDCEEEEDRMTQILRLKQTSFSNQLQLLTEILQVACVDGIPILIVLDELENFMGGPSRKRKAGWMHQDRQLLFYHLLERVATEGSLCSLVGLTADSGVMTKLEKRIKSRAEGTAKFLLTGPCQSYEDLVKVLCSQIEGDSSQAETLEYELSTLLRSPTSDDEQQQRVHGSLLRCYRLGKDLRWFSRVLYSALALYRYDLIALRHSNHDAEANTPPLHAKYLDEALMDMGGSLLRGDGSGASHTTITEPDYRMQALRDLSGPQVALILAARRILFRDNSARQQDEASQQPRLTLNRMLHEYKSSYKGQSSRYSERLLQKGFVDLMEVNLLRPATDHTGSGPFQYQHRHVPLGNHNNMDIVERMPLHLTLDIHRELKQAIDGNMLNCSTALREWGRKAN